MTALELPSWRGTPDDTPRVRDQIDAWATSAALAAVVAAFEETVPALRGGELLRWLDAFAGARWDFRSGRERNLARRVSLTAAQTDIVMSRAGDLGLAGRATPRHDAYDTVLMTGGMVRAGVVKPRFVASAVAGGLAVRHVVFLGAFRTFAGDEAELASALGVDGDDEVDAMLAGMERAFGPLGDPEVSESIHDTPHASWREYSWSTQPVRLSVIAAPSSDPANRRADSADTYRFWAEHRRRADERSVIQVTTPVYVPYQGARAVEILGVGHGLAVETIGVSQWASDLGELTQRVLPHHYLQELRAAIGAMRSLRELLGT
jgi:hypothetical protein